MKKILELFLVSLISLWGGCSMADEATSLGAPGGVDSLIYPPLPRLPSPIPLKVGNEWNYTISVYNSTGGKTFNGDSTMVLKIVQGFVIQNKTLTPITSNTVLKNYQWSELAFSFEWNGSGEGLIYSYRDLKDPKGIFVVGSFSDTVGPTLFDSAVLFLNYPASAQTSWVMEWPEQVIDGKSPGSTIIKMVPRDTLTVMASDTTFYFRNFRLNGEVPLDSRICALYRHQNGTKRIFRFFNEDFGELGYLEYREGKLYKTLMLINFKSNG